MSNTEIHTVAADVSALINRAEIATDESIIAVANLIAGTAKARGESGLTAAKAQPTLLRLNRALSRVIDGGTDVVRAHGDLSIKYKEIAGGDIHPYTELAAQEGPRASLRLVNQ